MFAGLPGTGVGGILYLLLTAWMPIHELIMMARGRSTPGRWAFIVRHWLVFGGVVAMIVAQTALMRWLIPAQQKAELKASVASLHGGVAPGLSDMLLSTAAMSAASLCVIVLVLHLARVGLHVRRMITA